MQTLQDQVKWFLCLVWAHSVHSSSTLAALWEQLSPLSPWSLCSTPQLHLGQAGQCLGHCTATVPAKGTPSTLTAGQAQPEPFSCSQTVLQSLDLGLVLPLNSTARLLLQRTEHCKPWRTGECAHAPQQGLWKVCFCLEEDQNLDLFQDTKHLH